MVGRIINLCMNFPSQRGKTSRKCYEGVSKSQYLVQGIAHHLREQVPRYGIDYLVVYESLEDMSVALVDDASGTHRVELPQSMAIPMT